MLKYKNNVLNKTNFLANKIKVIIVLSVVLLGFGVVYAVGTINAGFRATNSPQIVDAHGVCKEVRTIGGDNVFVPTKTSAEWSAFRNNKPANVEAKDCCVSYDYEETDWTYKETGANPIYWYSWNNSVSEGETGAVPTQTRIYWYPSPGAEFNQTFSSNETSVTFGDYTYFKGAQRSWWQGEIGGTCCSLQVKYEIKRRLTNPIENYVLCD